MTRKKQQPAILIDGSNFYFKLSDLGLGEQTAFAFDKFATFLSRSKSSWARYYVGGVKTSRSIKSKRMHAQQQRLLAHLKKCHFSYYLGYLLKSDGVYKEKGVDVQIAVDMVCQSYENQVNNFFLVSSDSDLIPAVEVAQSQGKIVTYVGFKHKPSYSLLQTCRRSILLTKEDLEPFSKVK